MLTPMEAEKILRPDPDSIHVVDEMLYEMDGGPTMSPPSAWAPMATDLATGRVWFCSGEPGDPITEETTWVES